MLAYVFWHWPYDHVDTAAYERDQLAFHAALAASRPTGFERSATFRVDPMPWLTGVERRYEDWYLVEDFAALGPLNDQAVAGICQEPHQRIARATAAGAGGLYRLLRGTPDAITPRFVAWIVKGPQRSYEQFYDDLEPLLTQPGVGLWRRQMVLGPAPEFCLLTPTPVNVSAGAEQRLGTRDPLA